MHNRNTSSKRDVDCRCVIRKARILIYLDIFNVLITCVYPVGVCESLSSLEVDELAVGGNNGTLRFPGTRSTIKQSDLDNDAFAGLSTVLALSNETVTYSIVNTAADGNKFTVKKRISNGITRFTMETSVALDYESRFANGKASSTQTPYTFDVKATVTSGSFITCPVSVLTMNVNEKPILQSKGPTFSVLEGSTTGTVIGNENVGKYHFL